MKLVSVPFNQGIETPPKLGSIILKPTSEGKASYAQNVDFSNDEYGLGVVVPGPALTTIGNNSELTGVPFGHAMFAVAGVGYLWFIEGILGATNKLRKVENLVDSGSIQIDTDSLTVDDSGHANIVLTDLLIRDVLGSKTGYILGKDDSDGWIKSFSPSSSGAPSITATQGLTSFNTAREPKGIVGKDNVVYIGHGYHLDAISTAAAYSVDKFTFPQQSYGVTCLATWQAGQSFLVVAYNTDFPHNFGTRKNAGRAGIMLWDYVSADPSKDVECPSRYISAMKQMPSGGLVVFGGLNEGKTTVYEFTGYGFDKKFSYIGDMPRNNHSVDFDGEGRLVWITADGQICRYSFDKELFEHLGTINTGSSAGGILRKAVGGSGNEFLAASGSGSTYTLKKVQFGSYIGDDNSASDTTATPMVVSGTQALAENSTIQEITLPLSRPLMTGEKVELRVYKNGSTTDYETYLTMSFDTDGAISSKREVKALENINIYNLAVVWKQTDGLATAPPVLPAIVGVESTH